MNDDTCSIEQCERPRKCRGYCDTHYKRWLQGRPLEAPFKRTRCSERQCTVDGCERKQFALKMCQCHYSRNRKYGDPLLGPPPAQKFSSIEERFWAKVDKTGDCWVWTAHLFHDGYGQFATKTKGVTRTWRAHRIAYEWAYGPIPDGMLVDHRCHNRRCVNPDHLRLATRNQNNQNRQGAQSNSRSGIRGVQQLPSGRWQARVRHRRQDIHVGIFDTAEQAEAAAIAKRNELFTHNDRDRLRV